MKGDNADEPLTPYSTENRGQPQHQFQHFQQGPATAVMLLGPKNAVVTCPHCRANIKTALEHSSTSRTHRTALACCIFCCCCLPYCMNTAKNVDHYCPNCKAYLGTYER